jgi:hypothetical protein
VDAASPTRDAEIRLADEYAFPGILAPQLLLYQSNGLEHMP